MATEHVEPILAAERPRRSRPGLIPSARPVTVELSTVLSASPDRVWEEVNRPALLCHVSGPLLTFEPLTPAAFPERWAEQEYTVLLRLFGIVPVGWQVIGIEQKPPEGALRRLRDNGRSRLIQRWDHLITVEPEGPEHTRYTDRIEIDAGWLTPLIWAFARALYAHRQRRWRRLVASGFRYEGAPPTGLS